MGAKETAETGKKLARHAMEDEFRAEIDAARERETENDAKGIFTMSDDVIAFPVGKHKKQSKKKRLFPEGFLVISIKQGTGCYRHLKAPKKMKLEEFADAILWAFEFDNDHAHAFFMDNSAWSERNCYYLEEVDEESEFPHTCDHDLTVLRIGQKFKFVFDFGDNWVFDCAVLREIPDGTGDDVAIIRLKGEAPSQYSVAEDWNDETVDDETDEEVPDDEDDQ